MRPSRGPTAHPQQRFGPEAWRQVSAIRHEGIDYAIKSVSAWAYLSAKVVEASCLRPSVNSDEADCSRLIVMLSQPDTRVTIGPHGRRRPIPTHDTPHQMTMAAPGARQWGFFDQPSGPLRWLVLQFDVANLGRQLGEGYEPSDFRPRYMFHDPALLHFARQYEAACGDGEQHETLRDDMLALALLQSLARIERPHEDHPRGLSPSERRVVIEYMRARLTENIRLSELCNLVQLSPFHFCRAFKVSLGVSPHIWLIRERVRVAQSLLQEAHASLADVALAVGFYDQAHFTRYFRNVVGLPPGRWLRARSA
ncbi:helix-turn-helix domain-containing protein [Paracoccus aestuariivivens]|uniref:Helix-turn-helix domain-containing protein n=1 Tax=Paracoccus aestuariivivens TaxID=1820333 RepID=A0A6L6JDI4_9RHOB|nr:AraC family transcriptional regulator [Paracoccus aestuariivivens]MTH79275.1 helix-turn-helix domain-containing protein [Paracoccus aestuariivivens]